MPDLLIVLCVGVAVAAVAILELLAAALPVLIVVVLVPPEERAAVAALLAAADSSRRLRLWPALRAAVLARRRQRVYRVPHSAGATGGIAEPVLVPGGTVLVPGEPVLVPGEPRG